MHSNHNLRTPRAKAGASDNMIPLINIVFLLLIFFMVAGQMKQPQVEALQLPQTQLGDKNITEAANAPTLIEISIDTTLYLHGKSISLDALDLAIRNGDFNPQQLQLRADQRLQAEQLDPLLTLLRRHQITSIQLFTEAPVASL